MSLVSSPDPNVGLRRLGRGREGGREGRRSHVVGKTITGFANVEEDVADQVAGRQVRPWRIEDATNHAPV